MVRTQSLVSQYYKWLGLATAVEAYVRSCDTCARNKVVRHAPFGLLSPLPIPSRPSSYVSLDRITKVPPSHYHDAILVVEDRLTKMPIFIVTTKSMSASDVAYHVCFDATFDQGLDFDGNAKQLDYNQSATVDGRKPRVLVNDVVQTYNGEPPKGKWSWYTRTFVVRMLAKFHFFL